MKDVAEAISFALREELEGTHLLAGDEVLSVADMLQELCSVFTPDQLVQVEEGGEASDQVIRPSSLLPKTRPFREALLDIRKDGRR